MIYLKHFLKYLRLRTWEAKGSDINIDPPVPLLRACHNIWLRHHLIVKNIIFCFEFYNLYLFYIPPHHHHWDSRHTHHTSKKDKYFNKNYSSLTVSGGDTRDSSIHWLLLHWYWFASSQGQFSSSDPSSQSSAPSQYLQDCVREK